MSVTLDAVNARHLWHMQDIGRLWEQHALKCGSPVAVSILLDIPSQAPGQPRSTVHVFPASAGSDETFLSRVLDAYSTRVTSQVLIRDYEEPAPVDGGRTPADVAPLSTVPPNDVPRLATSNANPLSSPKENLSNGVGAAAEAGDEFGLKRFQSTWRQERPIRYADVEHLCPRIIFLKDDDPTGGAGRPVVRLEDDVVNAFLDLVGKPSLQTVSWEVVNGVTSCARFFIDKVSLNKAWYCIGPVEARTVSYVYNIAGVDVYSLSVASMASKEGGVSLHERALTIAVLCALSPFWRMVVVASSLFKPGRPQARRARKAGLSKVKRPRDQNAFGHGPTKAPRVGSKVGGVNDPPLGTPSSPDPPGSAASSAAVLNDGQELKLWMDAPGLDVEDRPVSEADIVGRSGWFWRHRPQPGDRCLSLLSYKTLGDLYRLRGGRVSAGVVSGTFGRLVNVPGDNDCFYHVIANGLLDRLGSFPNLPKSNFWQDVGVHPGLLRWGVAAYQRAMLGNGPLSYLFPTWLGLTCPGQSFTQSADGQAVLDKAIKECEGNRSWMGSYHGEYAVLADILGAIIRVFSPIGCQPDGSLVVPPAGLDPGHFSIADARIDVVGGDGARRCVVRPGKEVVQLKPSCVHVPLHLVAQATREAVASGTPADAGIAVHRRAKEMAVARGCMVLGVVHDGEAHFMYPFVYPELLADYTGAALPAFRLSPDTSE